MSHRCLKFLSSFVGQYKDLAVHSRFVPLSKAASLNGVQWKGSISSTASAGRVFPHDTDIPTYSATARKLDVWSEWKAPDLASYFSSVEKRNGVINLTRKPPMQITPVKCNEIRNKLTQKGMACVQSRKVFPPFVWEILL
jgi:hypothetical protein